MAIEKNVVTITLDGTEQTVEFSKPYPFFFIGNRSDDTIYASFSSEFTEGEAGVFDIPAKTMQRIDTNGGVISKFYIKGSGEAYIRPSENAFPPSFKEVTEGGGGSGGTDNYNDLSGKPQINGITLSGDKTFDQLGLEVGGRNYIRGSKEIFTINSSSGRFVKKYTINNPNDFLNKKVIGSCYVLSYGNYEQIPGSEQFGERFGIFFDVTYRNTATEGTIKAYYTPLLFIPNGHGRYSFSRQLKKEGFDCIDKIDVLIECAVRPTGDNVWEIGYPKLEIGTEATDWTPAPEDLEYTLPVAASDTLGGVKPDGKTVTVSNNGVLSAVSSNTNLIINPDFRINQRGVSEFSVPAGAEYTVDNWYISTQGGSANGSLTADDNGLRLRVNSASETYWFGQDLDAQKFLGKTLTVSFEVTARADTDNSHFYVGCGENILTFYSSLVHVASIPVGVSTVTFTVPENLPYKNLKIAFLGFSDITIKWVKLELGDTATAFIPPDPVTELLKCQTRYGAFYGVSHNSFFRGANITEAYDSGRFSAAVADGSFDDIYMGDYIEKAVTVEGTTYNVRGYVVDCDPFFGGYDNYAIVNTHHVGLFLVGLPNHRMNASDSTEGGYASSEMQSWLTYSVLPALEAVFGAEHLLAHRKILSSEVDINAANKSGGKFAGASNNWSWVNSKISLLTEVQVKGTTVWSSSAWDTGEACQQLAAFRFVAPHFFIGNDWWWLRDVASASGFAYYGAGGDTGAIGASTTGGACPLILLK